MDSPIAKYPCWCTLFGLSLFKLTGLFRKYTSAHHSLHPWEKNSVADSMGAEITKVKGKASALGQ